MSGHSVLASCGLMHDDWLLGASDGLVFWNDWPCTAADGKKVKQKTHKKKKREIDKPAASPVTASAHPGERFSALYICQCSATALPRPRVRLSFGPFGGFDGVCLAKNLMKLAYYFVMKFAYIGVLPAVQMHNFTCPQDDSASPFQLILKTCEVVQSHNSCLCPDI